MDENKEEQQNDNAVDYVELIDDEGETFRLETVGRVEYQGDEFAVFLPAEMDEDDPDFGFVILKCAEQDGMEAFDSVDDDAVRDAVYELFLQELYAEDEEAPAGNGEE